MFRRLYTMWLVWWGKAVDIWSKKAYPANVLSNLWHNPFEFDGVACNSMEGFLQSLKIKDADQQRQICSLSGKEAKNMSSSEWQREQIVWWKGQPIDRQSGEFQTLLLRAYRALFEQNEQFRNALMSTKGMRLCHIKGERNPYLTILTEQEFCKILTEIRDNQ